MDFQTGNKTFKVGYLLKDITDGQKTKSFLSYGINTVIIFLLHKIPYHLYCYKIFKIQHYDSLILFLFVTLYAINIVFIYSYVTSSIHY